MPQLIIFDWDDVFTTGATTGYRTCYHAALVDVGVELDPAEEARRIDARWGSPHQVELAGLLQEDLSLLPAAIESYEQHLFGDTFVDCLALVPGSVALLNQLAPRYTLAIASGAHPTVLRERIMPTFGIPDVFAQIITAYDVPDGYAKPHPYSLEQIMQANSIEPNETVMVGDATNDVLAAHAAGATPIVVLTGHLSSEEATALNVEHIIPNVSDLPRVL